MDEVLVTDDPMIDPDAVAAHLDDARVTVAAVDDTDDLVDAASEAAAIVVDVTTPVPRRAIEALPNLSLVARAGVGIENIDVGAAAEHGVTVTNAPAYCTDEVATHTLALLLDCARNISTYDRATAAGGWAWTDGRSVRRVPGSTLGLVSFGPIARRLRERVRGLDVDVIAYDPYVDADAMATDDVEKVDFEGLLERSDYVSLHAPLTEQTRDIVDADALARMRDHAILVNTARGGLVDEAALADALRDGTIAAAGLDARCTEPPAANDPLRELDNCILTPHAGWYSVEARDELNQTVGRNVAAGLAGETPPDRIDPDLDWV